MLDYFADFVLRHCWYCAPEPRAPLAPHACVGLVVVCVCAGALARPHREIKSRARVSCAAARVAGPCRACAYVRGIDYSAKVYGKAGVTLEGTREPSADASGQPWRAGAAAAAGVNLHSHVSRPSSLTRVPTRVPTRAGGAEERGRIKYPARAFRLCSASIACMSVSRTACACACACHGLHVHVRVHVHVHVHVHVRARVLQVRSLTGMITP